MVTDCRSCLAELFGAGGGAQIVTSSEGIDVARTLIQPDGDVLCQVNASLADGTRSPDGVDGLLQRHLDDVGQWLAKFRSTIESATALLSGLSSVASTVIRLTGLGVALATWETSRLVLSAAPALVGFVLAAVVRYAVRAGLRRILGFTLT